MKKNFILFGGVAALFALAGAFISHKQTEPQPAASSAVSNLLSQSMSDSQGKQQNLGQWKNKPLLINFWATWCTPCVDEMPELSALQTELGAQKIQIIGIGIDSPSNISEFASKYQIQYPLYVAGMSGSELSRQLGNQAGGLPFTVLIGSDGQIRRTYLGRLKMADLRKDLAAL